MPYVDAVSYALGAVARSVDDVAKDGALLTNPDVLRRVGFAEQRRAAAGQTALDLAVEAVAKLEARLGKVDVLVYATTLPGSANAGDEAQFAMTRDVKHLMDFTASALQARFGLDDASVIGVGQQGCTSMFGAIRVANALCTAEPDIHRVLCVVADRFPSEALYEQTFNLISDGAAACLVTREPARFRILASHAITNGALGQAKDEELVGSYFSYSHKLVSELLARARVAAGDVTWIVPQNLNKTALHVLLRSFGWSLEQAFCESMAICGHAISADNLINLALFEETGRIQRGEKVVLFVAGTGANWQGLLLEAVT